MLEFQKVYTFNDILEYLRNIYKDTKSLYDDNNSWCIYSNTNEISLGTICYLEDYPEINDEDEEFYSQFIVDNALELICYDETIQDVLISALNQNKDLSNLDLLNALNYYLEHDNFIYF